MTNRVYAIDLQGLEPPTAPSAPATGASPEERAGYRESVSEHRKQVRSFCDSLAAELTGIASSVHHCGVTCTRPGTASHS